MERSSCRESEEILTHLYSIQCAMQPWCNCETTEHCPEEKNIAAKEPNISMILQPNISIRVFNFRPQHSGSAMQNLKSLIVVERMERRRVLTSRSLQLAIRRWCNREATKHYCERKTLSCKGFWLPSRRNLMNWSSSQKSGFLPLTPLPPNEACNYLCPMAPYIEIHYAYWGGSQPKSSAWKCLRLKFLGCNLERQKKSMERSSCSAASF